MSTVLRGHGWWLLTLGIIAFANRFGCAQAAAPAGPRLPLEYSGAPAADGTVDATVKVRAAAVRTEPSNHAKLIGYLPGATRMYVYVNRMKLGWVQIAPSGSPGNWSTPNPIWIKRSEVALQDDYRPFSGKWPLIYLELTAEGINDVWAFPPNNRCTKQYIKSELPKIAKATHTSLKDVSCEELWFVPNTNLVFANPNPERKDIWYNRKTGKIFVNTIFGSEAGFVIYGYKDGRVLQVATVYPGGYGRSVASPMSDVAKLSKDPRMSDPTQHIWVRRKMPAYLLGH